MIHVSKTDIKFLIHQSNLIEGFDDEMMDATGYDAWFYLLGIPFKALGPHHIRVVQQMITETQPNLKPHERGEWRKIPVLVGNQVCPNPAMVPDLVFNWLLDYQDLDPVEAHIRFERIHPFVDGNGRTGRILLWWMEMHCDLPLTEILNSNKEKYYEWFK